MPWIIPLVTIAAGVASKIADAKRASDEHDYQKQQAKKQTIYNIKTAGLGGNQFQEMADRYKMGADQSEHAFGLQERARLEEPNNIGIALQGISAASKIGDSGSAADSFGKFTDERPGYDALKAAESSDGGSIGTSNPFQLDEPSLLKDDDDYSLDSSRFNLRGGFR